MFEKVKLWKKNREENVDGRLNNGKSPGSLEALQKINAEKRLAKRAQEEELVRLREENASLRSAVSGGNLSKSSSSASPVAPANTAAAASSSSGSTSISAASQFFEDMMRYEAWKQQVYTVEDQKRAQIRSVLEKEFQTRLEEVRSTATEQDPMDPMVEQAGKYLLDLLFSAKSGQTAPPLPPAAIAPQSPQNSAVAPAPSPAQPPPSSPDDTATKIPSEYDTTQGATKTFSNLQDPRQDEADEIADVIEDQDPARARAVRSGEIPKDRALELLRTNLPRFGKDPGLAELVYKAIMEVEE